LIGVARDHNTFGGNATRRTVVIAARLSLGELTQINEHPPARQ